jgi:hypothetical protein
MPYRAFSAAFDVDKVAHFAVSYAMADTVAPLMENTSHPVLYSFAIGMMPGLAKRIWDQKSEYDSREKNQDMVANILGAASGALIGHGVMLYARRDQVSMSYSKTW